MVSSAIIPFDPKAAAALALAMKNAVIEIRQTTLQEGIDFGKVPGTSKDVLLKPGAERLCSAFKLTPEFNGLTIIEDWQNGLFVYRYVCVLRHRETGEIYGSGIGSCNSKESKYAWRWIAEDRLPGDLDPLMLEHRDARKTLTEFAFAIEKAETSGPYAKSIDYWQMWQDAVANSRAKSITRKTSTGKELPAFELTTGVVEYRVSNPDIYDLVNTIDKMAQKRALIAATLIATNASEFFTQDMEDFASVSGDVVEGKVEDVTPPAEQKNGNGKKDEGPKAPAWWKPVIAAVKDLPHFGGNKNHVGNALNKMVGSGEIQEDWTEAQVIEAVKAKYDQPEAEQPPARDFDQIPF